jgi:hypothetical protein
MKTITVNITFKNNPVPLVICGLKTFKWEKFNNVITNLEWEIHPDRGICSLDYIRLDEIVAITSTDENDGMVN